MFCSDYKDSFWCGAEHPFCLGIYPEINRNVCNKCNKTFCGDCDYCKECNEKKLLSLQNSTTANCAIPYSVNVRYHLVL
jgi:hypothetical protein